jgi:hypothetical protein
MSSDYPGPQGRLKAIKLGATEAGPLIFSALPFVPTAMTAAQIGLVQKVLDAAVVNPALEKEYSDLMRKAIVDPALVKDYQHLARYSSERYRPFETKGRDPNMVRQAEKLLEGRISVTEADKRVRLDFSKLVVPGALKVTSDNPDEKTFMTKIQHTLVVQGVWLRFEPQFVRNPNDYSKWTVSNRTFRAWLSVGPYGASIPSKDGRISRDALMSGPFALGYYNQVVKGKVQSALDDAIKLVATEKNHWKQVHQQWEAARNTAKPGVVWISDHLGGADYPSLKVWDAPDHLLKRAQTERDGGKLKRAAKSVAVAALATQFAAKQLNQYIDDEMKGAGRAVKALSFAAKAGKVAGDILIITGAFSALTELIGTEAADAGIRAAAERQLTAGPAPPRALPPGPPPPRALPPGNPNPNYYRGGPAVYANTESGLPFAKTEQRLNTAVEDLRGGTNLSVVDQVAVGRERNRLTFNQLDSDMQQQLTGWLDEFERLATAGAGGDYVLTVEQLDQIYDTVAARWGYPGSG